MSATSSARPYSRSSADLRGTSTSTGRETTRRLRHCPDLGGSSARTAYGARSSRLKRFELKTENRSRNNGSGQRFIASNGDSRHPTAEFRIIFALNEIENFSENRKSSQFRVGTEPLATTRLRRAGATPSANQFNTRSFLHKNKIHKPVHAARLLFGEKATRRFFH